MNFTQAVDPGTPTRPELGTAEDAACSSRGRSPDASPQQGQWRTLLAPFYTGGRPVLPLILLFCLLNATVLVNAVLHDGRIQYDDSGHIQNLKDYGNLRFPKPRDTIQFFCPPLPYIGPGLLAGWYVLDMYSATKIGQLINVCLSLLLSYTLLRLLWWVSPDRPILRVAAVGLLTMLPVYYRTFSYVRGEPFVATFGLLSMYYTLRVFWGRETSWPSAIKLGLAMGLTALSRQWGMLLLAACAGFAFLCCLRNMRRQVPLLKAGVLASAVALIAGGWFYVHLHVEHGSITAFNKPPSDRHKSPKFFLGGGNGELFRRPIRGSFDAHGAAVLYSDTWGDYWGYFLLGGRNPEDGSLVHGYGLKRARNNGTLHTPRTNAKGMARYLGIVNAVALLPSVIMGTGFLVSLLCVVRCFMLRPIGHDEALRILCATVVTTSLAGLAWFAMNYRISEHSTIKATYILQAFPPLAILGAYVLEGIHRLWPRAFRVLCMLLVLAVCCIVPAWFTRYIPSTLARFLERIDPFAF